MRLKKDKKQYNILYKGIVMINGTYRSVLVSLIAFGGLITTSQVAAKTKIKKHNIQLQLADSLGFPIVGSEFWVTLEVIRESLEENKSLVTLQLPLINFQTQAAPSPDNPFGPGLVPGGYLYTSDGFLSRKNRPFVLVPPSIVAASDNGHSLLCFHSRKIQKHYPILQLVTLYK